MSKRKGKRPAKVILSTSLLVVPMAFSAEAASTGKVIEPGTTAPQAQFSAQWQLLKSAYDLGTLRLDQDRVHPSKNDIFAQSRFRNIAWGNG